MNKKSRPKVLMTSRAMFSLGWDNTNGRVHKNILSSPKYDVFIHYSAPLDACKILRSEEK